MSAVHFSRLKLMAKSPLHYAAAETMPPADTPSLRLGRLVHFLVLGGDFAIYDGRRAGKEWEAFEAEHADSEIFTRTEELAAWPMAEAVTAHPDARALLVGEHERPFQWTLGGRDCAGRLDVLGRDFIADLKTTASAAPGKFTRATFGFSYHAQMDWYRHGAELAGLGVKSACFLIAVETKPPYVVQCYELTPGALEQGRKLWWSWWEQLMGCERSDVWGGYANGIWPIEPEEESDYGLVGIDE